MELNHFSHEHPLILSEEEEESKKDICFGCRKAISSLPSYNCKACDFFLHKTCAEGPKEIKHPVDPQHILTLHAVPPYNPCYCNICRKEWESFTYHCAQCNIDVCIGCALEERTIDHDSHEHPLSLLRRPADFFCNACGTEAKDSSYVCANCEFWIHKSCASLPGTTTHTSHDHPLTLRYSLPISYRNFVHVCQICDKRINPPYWIYHCSDCRFVTHVKCATSTTTSSGFDEVDEDPTLIFLPVSDVSIDLIRIFVSESCSANVQNATEINHRSHDEHALFLSEAQNESGTNNSSIVCNCCVGPIAGEFYNCTLCSYFLHLYCAALPEQLQNPFQHEHSLFLGRPDKFFNFFKCNACEQISNGFFYGCETCPFSLDVKCASLPKTINHKAHKHPLTQSIGVEYECNACGISYSGFSLGCATCKFHICYTCTLLPRTVRHRWDKHLLDLMYPPVAHHPDEFYCEICEEELHPRDWLYHCRECDQSFHPRCICLLDDYPNVKFGDSLRVENHPHHLTFIRKCKSRTLCKGCAQCLDGYTVFQCRPCNFHLCRQCASDKDS